MSAYTHSAESAVWQVESVVSLEPEEPALHTLRRIHLVHTIDQIRETSLHPHLNWNGQAQSRIVKIQITFNPLMEQTVVKLGSVV